MEKTPANAEDKKYIAFFLKVQAPVIMRSASMSVRQPSLDFKRPKTELLKGMFKGWFGKAKAIRMLETYNDALTMQVVLMVAHQRIDTLSQTENYFLEDVLNIIEAAHDALGTLQTLKDQQYVPGACWNMGWIADMLTFNRGIFNRGIAEPDWEPVLSIEEKQALKKKLDADRMERRALRAACGDTGFAYPPPASKAQNLVDPAVESA